MARLLRFEAFDMADEDEQPPGPSGDWLAGHAQGVADATTASEAQHRALEDAALSSLADLSFTWAEARHSVLAALAPFFRELADRLLPSLMDDAFRLHLVDVLEKAATADVAALPGLSLAPDEAAVLGPVLAQICPDVRVFPDPSLMPGQARLSRGERETALDTPALIAALRELLGAWGDATRNDALPEGQRAHG